MAPMAGVLAVLLTLGAASPGLASPAARQGILSVLRNAICYHALGDKCILSYLGRKITDLGVKRGNVIRCLMENDLTEHYLMAVSDTEVVHIADNRVVRQAIQHASTRRDKCVIEDREVDNDAAERAEGYVGSCVPYDLLTCNCQHYVNFWKQGETPSVWSNQSWRGPASDCLVRDVKDKFEPCPSPSGKG